jgi:hypothetical protein
MPAFKECERTFDAVRKVEVWSKEYIDSATLRYRVALAAHRHVPDSVQEIIDAAKLFSNCVGMPVTHFNEFFIREFRGEPYEG